MLACVQIVANGGPFGKWSIAKNSLQPHSHKPSFLPPGLDSSPARNWFFGLQFKTSTFDIFHRKYLTTLSGTWRSSISAVLYPAHQPIHTHTHTQDIIALVVFGYFWSSNDIWWMWGCGRVYNSGCVPQAAAVWVRAFCRTLLFFKLEFGWESFWGYDLWSSLRGLLLFIPQQEKNWSSKLCLLATAFALFMNSFLISILYWFRWLAAVVVNGLNFGPNRRRVGHLWRR